MHNENRRIHLAILWVSVHIIDYIAIMYAVHLLLLPSQGGGGRGGALGSGGSGVSGMEVAVVRSITSVGSPVVPSRW